MLFRSDGCSASTAVLHLASSVLSDLGMPVGTICDTPKAQLDQHKMWDCKKGTPSTDEIMRCNNNAYCEADDAADVVESSLEVVRAEGDRSGTSDMDSDDPNSEGASRQYAITIAPNSTLAFWVVYEPRVAQVFDFELPLAFQASADASRLRKRVRGTGLRPKIVMSKTVVDFEDRVVPRDPSRRVPFSDEVQFTNHHLAGITWELDDTMLREGDGVAGGGGGGGGEGGRFAQATPTSFEWLQWPEPGLRAARCEPASPSKRYQAACSSVEAAPMGCSSSSKVP